MTPASGELLEVLVVGAGPTGLTLAAQLRAFGATVRIVDRQLDRVHESRALGVQPRTMEVLRGLGLAEELIERGNDAVWVQLHAGGRVVRIRLFGLGLDDTAYPFLLFVSQAETEQVLGDHLATGGILVERGVELVGFHADPDAVACLLRHRDGRPEQVRARARAFAGPRPPQLHGDRRGPGIVPPQALEQRLIGGTIRGNLFVSSFLALGFAMILLLRHSGSRRKRPESS